MATHTGRDSDRLQKVQERKWRQAGSAQMFPALRLSDNKSLLEKCKDRADGTSWQDSPSPHLETLWIIGERPHASGDKRSCPRERHPSAGCGSNLFGTRTCRSL